MPSSILNISIDNTQNIPIIIGNIYTFSISIKNLSSVQRLYNLSLFLKIPDGMSIYSATSTQTNSITNADNSTTYTWINLKDLAPMEINYSFSITLKCNNTFRNGSIIPFDYIFSGISILAQVDTMPRGNYDIGNEIITSQVPMTFQTVRFSSSVATPSKVLKGAGTSSTLNDYTQINTATCKFYNNSISTSLVNITILLDDGIRYLGSITTSGTDSRFFTKPTISLVSIDNKLYTQLYFGNINLSIGSNTTVNFNFAVWNQYNNNKGSFIYHKTPLQMYINMLSANPNVSSKSSSSTSFAAMDLIVTTSTKSIVDVQNSTTYNYIYKVGQYYNIQNIVVHYFLPDGIYYLSSSVSPTSVINSTSLQGFYLTYDFPLATQNSTKSITINTKVDSYYRFKLNNQSEYLPVVASDPFLADVDITGTLMGPLTNVTDTSNTTSRIGVGNIAKQFVKAYYRDKTPKSINVLAVGDLAEYMLSYNASTLRAIQKQVYIDDFFPLSASPINNLTYDYNGVKPVTIPQLISPHGVDFYYGDIVGLSTASINFTVPISQQGTLGQNANLMKLKGINTYGDAYSNRAQVNFNIGSPNLQLSKTIIGPNKNAIKSSEVYRYTVTISNTNNLGTETDAFSFSLTDTLSSWFTLNKDTLAVSGNGDYGTIQVKDDSIVLPINKLAPGKFITISYNVTLSSIIPPSLSITTTASNSNPYSQIYDDSYPSNYQYLNLVKSASATLSSASISLSKSNIDALIKVGSLITYTITLTIPQGTIVFGLYVRDILPNGNQTYVGPSYRNGVLIKPTTSSSTITLPSEGTLDARISAITINYVITARVIASNKSIDTITSIQNNSAQCIYQKVQGGPSTTINKTLKVSINHPNLLMSLSVVDKTTSTLYTQNANISTHSILQFKLTFKNNSNINLLNGTIQIPINPNFLFVSIANNVLCNASYNASNNNILVSIPQLGSSVSGSISFTLIPQPILKTGTIINIQAIAISYYNDIWPTKVYSGEQSNVISCSLLPGVSLLPNPTNKIDNSTSFIITQPGNTAVIINHFKNTGGGYDDFTLTIQKVSIPYTLYIDKIKIASIPANTLYQANLPSMTNLAPNSYKLIEINAVIPKTGSLGVRYDFTVTATSKTSPTTTKTVLNIDPPGI